MFEWTGEVLTKNEVKREKSLARKLKYNEIKSNEVLGKEIALMSGEKVLSVGVLIYYENKNGNKKNTGYYVNKNQVPLLQIKEVGGYFIRI